MGEIKAKIEKCCQCIQMRLQRLSKNEKMILAIASIFLLIGFVILIAPKQAKVIRIQEQKALAEANLSVCPCRDDECPCL